MSCSANQIGMTDRHHRNPQTVNRLTEKMVFQGAEQKRNKHRLLLIMDEFPSLNARKCSPTLFPTPPMPKSRSASGYRMPGKRWARPANGSRPNQFCAVGK